VLIVDLQLDYFDQNAESVYVNLMGMAKGLKSQYLFHVEQHAYLFPDLF